MPSILWRWPMIPEVDTGGMAVEAELSYQYSDTFCCCVTDGSRGAIWENGAWHGSMFEAEVWNWIPPCRKNVTHWHSSLLTEQLWRSVSGCEHSKNWVVYFSTSNSGSPQLGQGLTASRKAGSCSLLAKKCRTNKHCWLCWKIVFFSWEFSLSNSVIVLFVAIVGSMEINKRHYFWSKLYPLRVIKKHMKTY